MGCTIKNVNIPMQESVVCTLYVLADISWRGKLGMLKGQQHECQLQHV